MKKLFSMFVAVAFALSIVGVAFAADNAAKPAAPALRRRRHRRRRRRKLRRRRKGSREKRRRPRRRSEGGEEGSREEGGAEKKEAEKKAAAEKKEAEKKASPATPAAPATLRRRRRRSNRFYRVSDPPHKVRTAGRGTRSPAFFLPPLEDEDENLFSVFAAATFRPVDRSGGVPRKKRPLLPNLQERRARLQ